MRRDPRAYLWDARRAAALVQEFVRDRTWQDYEKDGMLRSAVERQFEILGESLNQLSRLDRQTASRIADLPRIVAFRNLLIHGYAVVDDQLVWEVATQRIAPLIELLNELLADDEGT